MYPNFPADVVVLSSSHPVSFSMSNPDALEFIQKAGICPLILYNFEGKDEWVAWKDPKRRQYQVVERYQIPVQEEGRVDYGVVIRYKNSDGTYGFWKEVYIPKPGENISPNLQIQFDYGDPSHLQSLAYYPNASACKKAYTISTNPHISNVDLECKIFNPGQIPEPIKNWVKTGILKNVVANPDGTTSIDVPLSGWAGGVLSSQWNP